MKSNITILDSKNNPIMLNINNKNLIFKMLYDKMSLDSNIYDKISILDSILKSDEILEEFFNLDVLPKKNIIELFICDTTYSIILNSQITELITKFITAYYKKNINFITMKFKPNIEAILHNITLNYSKSKYEKLDYTISDNNLKTETELINFTMFLIEFYNNIDESSIFSKHKTEILDILIDTIDCGIINFIEEYNLVRLTINNLEDRISDLKDIIYAGDSSNEVITRYNINFLKSLLGKNKKRFSILESYKYTYSNDLVENFINYLVVENSKISNICSILFNVKIDKIIKIITTYISNKKILYKSSNDIVTFINNIISYSSINTEISYDLFKFYYNFLFNGSYNMKLSLKQYLKNNKLFLQKLLSKTLNIIENMPDKEYFIVNFCKIINYVFIIDNSSYNYILEINKNLICKFLFKVLNYCKKFNSIFHPDYPNIDADSYFEETELVENQNVLDNTIIYMTLLKYVYIYHKDLIYSFELRNLFFETFIGFVNDIYENSINEDFLKNIANKIEDKLSKHIISILDINDEFYEDISNNFTKLSRALTKINQNIKRILNLDYSKLVSIYSIGYIEFNKDAWDSYKDYTKLTNINIDTMNENIQNGKKIIDENYNNCMDPICSTFMEKPIYLDNDILVDSYIIYKYILEKKENPFTRNILEISDLEKINYNINISNKLYKYKYDNKYNLYNDFINKLKKN